MRMMYMMYMWEQRQRWACIYAESHTVLQRKNRIFGKCIRISNTNRERNDHLLLLLMSSSSGQELHLSDLHRTRWQKWITQLWPQAKHFTSSDLSIQYCVNSSNKYIVQNRTQTHHEYFLACADVYCLLHDFIHIYVSKRGTTSAMSLTVNWVLFLHFYYNKLKNTCIFPCAMFI